MIKFEYNYTLMMDDVPWHTTKTIHYIDPSEVAAVSAHTADGDVHIYLKGNHHLSVDGPLDVVMEKLGRARDETL